LTKSQRRSLVGVAWLIKLNNFINNFLKL
jgi:hypothetical protein